MMICRQCVCVCVCFCVRTQFTRIEKCSSQLHVYHLVIFVLCFLFVVLFSFKSLLWHTFYALSVCVLIRLLNVLKPLKVLKQHPAQQPHQLHLDHHMCTHMISKKLSMKSSVLVLTDLSRFYFFYFYLFLFIYLFIYLIIYLYFFGCFFFVLINI